jgi:hypothetical protein
MLEKETTNTHCVVKVLIRIVIIAASPNLKSDTIDVVPVLDIKALIVEYSDSTTHASKCPFLGPGSITGLDGDSSSIRVGRGG